MRLRWSSYKFEFFNPDDAYVILLFILLAQLVMAPTLSQRTCMFISAWPSRKSEVQLLGQTANTQVSILSRSVDE